MTFLILLVLFLILLTINPELVYWMCMLTVWILLGCLGLFVLGLALLVVSA